MVDGCVATDMTGQGRISVGVAYSFRILMCANARSSKVDQRPHNPDATMRLSCDGKETMSTKIKAPLSVRCPWSEAQRWVAPLAQLELVGRYRSRQEEEAVLTILADQYECTMDGNGKSGTGEPGESKVRHLTADWRRFHHNLFRAGLF